MFARKIIPILLVVGVVHMLKRHQYGLTDQPVADADQPHGSHFKHGPFDRGHWAKRVPPMFEALHNRAHAAMATPPASTSTPAI
jgi:hypothetical protein